MSVKDVMDYHSQVLSDYLELKKTLKLLENEPSEHVSKNILENIEHIKKNIAIATENYNRISYIVYLLNKPTRKRKQDRHYNINKKMLDKIPESSKLKSIREENKDSINKIKNYISC